MKNCPRCKENKNESEFRKNKKSKDGLQKYCSECDKLYQKEWYEKNKEVVIKKSRLSNLDIKKRNGDFIIEYLKLHPCVKCGESDIIVLEFDHIYDNKLSGVSNLVHSSTLDKIKEEVEKCQVLCANCHRKLHYDEKI